VVTSTATISTKPRGELGFEPPPPQGSLLSDDITRPESVVFSWLRCTTIHRVQC